jgi:hypothetical protein
MKSRFVCDTIDYTNMKDWQELVEGADDDVDTFAETTTEEFDSEVTSGTANSSEEINDMKQQGDGAHIFGNNSNYWITKSCKFVYCSE